MGDRPATAVMWQPPISPQRVESAKTAKLYRSKLGVPQNGQAMRCLRMHGVCNVLQKTIIGYRAAWCAHARYKP
jgi:hypothetical protein